MKTETKKLFKDIWIATKQVAISIGKGLGVMFKVLGEIMHKMAKNAESWEAENRESFKTVPGKRSRQRPKRQRRVYPETYQENQYRDSGFNKNVVSPSSNFFQSSNDIMPSKRF